MMNKIILLGALAAGGYWLYTKAKAQPVADALPTDATQVRTLDVYGVPVNVYLAQSGYYAQFTNPSNGQTKILGPYSQQQVSALLTAQSSLSNLLGTL